jgi:hypothetical protein
MADKKISALTAASTPLAGTEVLPIVQSGATVKVAVSDLTAGRAISATQITLTTGNVIVASGQGIDFSATPNTGTSELFDDYEEGTWSAVIKDASNNSATMSATTCTYTKIGRLVTVTGQIATSSVAGLSGAIFVTGLPFTCINGDRYYSGNTVAFASGLAIALGQSIGIFAEPNTTTANLALWDATTGTTQLLTTEWTDDGNIIVNFSYVTAA